MSVYDRLRILENMESVITRVKNHVWLNRAKAFLESLKDRLLCITDAELFTWLKDWEEKFLTEVSHELYSV